MSTNRTVTRTEFDALKSDVHEILALLKGSAPAKAAPKKPARNSRADHRAVNPNVAKAPAKKAAKKAPVTRHLCRKNRAEFVKAHPWAAGLSTQCIASMVVQEGLPLAKGWGIGERYTEMFAL